MTTYYNFTPSRVNSPPFQFSPTLDGATYNVVIMWNIARQGYYVNVYALDGTLIVSLPLIGSPTGLQISALSWDGVNANVALTNPHRISVGSCVQRTVTGVVPDGYNGSFLMVASGPSSLSYPLPTDPGGDATTPGAVLNNINLVAGYFVTSTLVFRGQSQQFEVAP